MKNNLSRLNSADSPLVPSSQVQLQMLFEASPDMICSIDGEGRFQRVSPACRSILGYEPEVLVGKPFLELVVEEDRSFTREVSNQIMAGLRVSNFENWYCRADGSRVPLSWSAHWDREAGVMLCIARDISPKKEKEALQARFEGELKIQNHKIGELLGRIRDGFFAMDEEWRITYINNYVEEMLAIRREDFLTRNFWECFPQMVGSVYYEQYHKAMHSKEPVHFDAYFEPFDKWFSVDAYPSDSGLSIFFRDVSEKKKEEAQHKEYEDRLERQNVELISVLERMNQGFFSLDKDLKVVYWNAAAEEIIDTSREEVLGKHLLDWYGPEARELYEPMYAQMRKDLQPLHSEHICPQNGKWVELTLYPSETGFTAFFRDINSRKRAEEELQMLSLIARETVNAVLLTGLDQKITWVNHAFTQMTGYEAWEAVGKDPGELLGCPEANPETLNFMRERVEKGVPFQSEILNRTKSGGRIWWNVFFQPVFDREGAIVQHFIIATDITRQKKTEEELQVLSLLAKETASGVSLVGLDSRITWINDAYTRITGYTAEEAIGGKHSELLTGSETDKRVLLAAQKAFRSGRPFRYDLLSYTKKGKKVWLEASGQPMYDREGKLQQYFVIHTDISERKRLSEELEEERMKVNAAVIAAQEEERALVGRELHDNVNQVLTTVKLYSELCRDGLGDTKEIMTKTVTLLQECIDEIRTLSKRLSAPTLGNIRLKDSVKELADAVGATGKIHITVQTEGIDGLEIGGDLHLAVYRILQEHLTNVLKYAEASQVQVDLTCGEGHLILQVTDNGRGFDTSKKHRGIGIANMITRAETLKGSLAITSAPGSGCALWARLPLGITDDGEVAEQAP